MISKLFSRVALSAVAAGMLAVATPAAASTVNLTQSFGTEWAENGDGDKLRAGGISISVDGRNNGNPFGVNAGAFGVTDGATDWLAFCIDLYQNFNIPADFDVVAGPAFPIVDRLNKLYTTYFEDVDTGTEAAAFQIAIWEIVSDGTLDLHNGVFELVTAGSSVVTQVNTYLTGLDQQTGGGYAFTFLKNDHYQDLVIASPVPLPAGALLLLGALGAMGVARRKAKAAA